MTPCAVSLQRPQLSLVGAGPGDPDLITCKGLKALQSADVLLYDSLVHPDLLEEVPSHAIRKYVGKRVGQHSYKQDHINELIVHFAEQYGHVVRLKGGDPFIFGRGHEEMLYAEAHGIPVQIIPGVTALASVPASQGIPVTKRGITDGCWVVTGTTKAGGLSKDLVLAAQSSSTLIIFMGTRKLSHITQVVRQHRPGNTPVAVIHNGTMDSESITLGDLTHICERYAMTPHQGPGLVVIGEVVAEHPEYFLEEITRVLYEV